MRVMEEEEEDKGKNEWGKGRMENEMMDRRTSWSFDVKVGARGKDLAVILRAYELDFEA